MIPLPCKHCNGVGNYNAAFAQANLGERLKILRLFHGHTFIGVDRAVGVSYRTVPRLEQGLVLRPRLYQLERLAKLYGVEVDDLMEGTKT